MKKDPLWYKDAIIYELPVKAFLDSSGDGIGDFKGLMSKLDYLEYLGITAVWLLPFYPSPLKDDGYDIADYHGIHSSYGTLKDFKLFVREAHKRGIRVITELVINHTSDQHPWFQASRRARRGSARWNYYVWSDTDAKYPETRIIFTDTETSNWAWDPLAGAYYWHRFFSHQPDLNLSNPAVVRSITKILDFWLRLGVDGLRLDAVPYLCEREGTNNENLDETHEVIRQFRRHVDTHFENRMLLAEANQWPEDVVHYFGSGDQCHMAFHFPLMPRMFMAIRQENREPITEILKRTPEIPANCQWALFLRNHDELTLEMVTDEERDYMYREYAKDSRMRINIGIRRRLAPLVDNSLRRRELLHSLLFSFPGTPIIYYGDEIGMGDNVHLGDRDGVRTPMQWSADRNAGFSKADPALLYLPVIMDPVYGYQAVNVESQERTPSSFFHFIRRMIALRKQYKAFGRGTMEFLYPENRRVLAYLRCYNEEVILAVANMSRFVQPAELDLSRFQGWTPVEMLGRVEFPTIGELPYFVTLGPHAFYWFRLDPPVRPVEIRTRAGIDTVTRPVISLERGIASLFEPENLVRLEHDVLPQYLLQQRFFRGKGRDLVGCRILDWTKLGSGFQFALAEVAYADGGKEVYALPLKVSSGAEGQRIQQHLPESVLASIRTPRQTGVLYDALVEKTACTDLVMAIGDSRRYPTTVNGELAARAFQDPATAYRSPLNYANLRHLGAEQSNTSVVIDNQLILKLFRQVEPGLNPDMEIASYLTDKTDFSHFAHVVGYMVYRSSEGVESTVALLQRFVPNEGDGWLFTQKALDGFFDRVRVLPMDAPPPKASRGSFWEVVGKEVPEALKPLFGGYLEEVRKLALRTAQFHLTLSREKHDRQFTPEPLGGDHLEILAEGFSQQCRHAMDLLNAKLPELSGETLHMANHVLEKSPPLLGVFQKLHALKTTAMRIRCHGDYHLGQVLRSEGDFVLLDFEGEPLKSIRERREKQSPMKDVAGMMRSFSYAVYSWLLNHTREDEASFHQLKPWAEVWEEWVSVTFVDTYLQVTQGLSFIPRQPEVVESLLRGFLLDKALYELQYEISNRPNWLPIPLHGILRFLEAGGAKKESS